jgi:pimeloyl-ACP methyl ester carboxylesterase
VTETLNETQGHTEQVAIPNYRYQDGWVVVDGLRLHFTEWGKPTAPPVLLLHGLNVQCHTWDPIAHKLAEEFHVYSLDMRGHGESDWAPSGYRVRQFAHDVHGVIEALGVGPVHLVGHSQGVRVAIAVAGERPETIKSLSLSDAGPQTTKDGALAMRDFITSTTGLTFKDEDDARAFYWSQHPEWQPEFIELHLKYQLRRNWAGKLVLKADPDLQWITGSASVPDVAYLWEMCANLSMPTFLMVGRTSNIFDEELVDKIAGAMPRATVQWFETGHYIPRERPVEFTGALLEFLRAS